MVGHDLRFTTDLAGTTEIPFEIVALDTQAETCEIHVKVPTVDYNDDTDIYVWYGNSDAEPYAPSDTYGAENSWNSNYKAVLHTRGSSLTAIKDSTSNDNHMDTQDGTPTFDQTGKIGKAIDFGGNSDIYKTSYSQVAGPITMSAWLQV